MSEQQFEDRPVQQGFPEVVDDDSPERGGYPEPEGPALGSDVGYVGTDTVDTTIEGEIEGESLDQKLAREVPDQPRDAASVPAGPGPDDAGISTEAAVRDNSLNPDLVPDDTDRQAGQLLAPDAGGGPDTEKDEVAEELPGAYDMSPEEQAMHVEPGPA